MPIGGDESIVDTCGVRNLHQRGAETFNIPDVKRFGDFIESRQHRRAESEPFSKLLRDKITSRPGWTDRFKRREIHSQIEKRLEDRLVVMRFGESAGNVIRLSIQVVRRSGED